jgi:hypoxanthine-DNA glycosylase
VEATLVSNQTNLMRYTSVLRKNTSLQPLSDYNSRVVILDTMPGEKSLILNQYYACKSNFFWKIIFKMLKISNQTDYRLKKQLLITRGIALWNVLEFNEQKEPGDYAITNETPNDFYTFFQNHPHIDKILFNGNTAADYYNQHIGYYNGMQSEILPSTSALNTWKSFEEKTGVWATALEQYIKPTPYK